MTAVKLSKAAAAPAGSTGALDIYVRHTFSDNSLTWMSSLHVLAHVPTAAASGNPGNDVRATGALRGVDALLRAVVGLLSGGELREDGDKKQGGRAPM